MTIPFGAIALLLIPLAVGADIPLLRRIGPGLFWAVVMLFGILIAVRRTATETESQRDLAMLLGIDPAAGFTGKAGASATLLVAFQLVVGVVAVLLYDIDVTRWAWLLVIIPGVAVGLALLGTITSAIASNLSGGAALIPFLVAPLSVPLLLAATEALDPLRPGDSILPWVLLMLVVDLVLAIAGVLSARPLQETR